MSTVVTLDGRQFRSDGAPDESGVRWGLQVLSGWDGGADVVGQSTKRPGAHGVFAERAYRGGKAFTLQGVVLCPTRPAAEAARRALAALVADGDLYDMTVTESDGLPLLSRVRLAAAPIITLAGPSCDVFFQLPLLAPDPLRYGALQSVTTGFPVMVGGLEYDLYTDGAGTDLGWLDFGEPSTTGTVELANAGTAQTWPVFEVAGPTPVGGFEIVASGSGRRHVYAGLVPAGSRLMIDDAAGVALMDGVSDRSLAWFEPAPILPGTSQAYTFLPRGGRTDATLTASTRPAYW